jgi:oxygen-independent coproporphyrinogen-3 oxidase
VIKHVYVHVPFCPRLCPYCNFFVVPADRRLSVPLVEKICAEMEWWKSQEELCFETVYFGGGTPSALDTRSLEKLVSGVLGGYWPREVTLEVNPTTVSMEKAKLLLDLGVNRISLGAQSFDDGELRTLGRQHSAERIIRTYNLLREAGFENVNVDLIFGTPGGSLEQWERTLQRAVQLQPEHISAYCLTYEEDTPFFEKVTSGQWRKPDMELEANFYEATQELLSENGYEQYEVSNYCRGEFWSRHNRAYWCGEDFLGLGPGAVSTIRGTRWRNRPDVGSYIAGRDFPCEQVDVEILCGETLLKERLMLGLRTRWGAQVPSEMSDFFVKLSEEGLAVCDGITWKLTRKGLRVADAVTEEIFAKVDEVLPQVVCQNLSFSSSQ